MKLLTGKNQNGFTLIETLFAVLIFSAALVSLMTIAGRGIVATKGAREQITAHYLAQEGLEIVRNIRDSNVKTSGTAWDTGFSQCTGSGCGVMYGNQASVPLLVDCGQVQSCDVAQAVDGAFIDYDANTTTFSGYNRTIVTTPVIGANNNLGTPDEYKIISTVSWTSRSIARKVVLVTILKKWQ